MKGAFPYGFNHIVIVLAVAFVISMFSGFSSVLGINSALFFLLSIALFFTLNSYSTNLKFSLFPVLFFVLAAVYSYYCADFRYNVRNGILLLSYCSAAYILTTFMKPEVKRGVLLIPVFIGLWLTLFLFSTNISFSDYMLPETLSKTARATAGFLILSFCVSLIFWREDRKIYMYTSFILLFAVILTKSYFAIGIVFIVFSVFLYFIPDSPLRKKHLFSAVSFILSCAAFIQAFKTGYFSAKGEILKTAVSVIKDNFLSGVGFGNYAAVSGAYAKIPDIDISSADNMFLQVFAETGIIGILLFCMIFAVFAVLIFKKLKSDEDKKLYLPVILAVAAFAFYNMFESTAFISTNMLLFFILLSFPIDAYEIKPRKKRIGSYAAIVLSFVLLLVLSVPLVAYKDYKNGVMFFAANQYSLSESYFIKAMKKDFLNPEYASKLSDSYFAASRNENNLLNMEKAVEYKKLALSLNKHCGKYYYDLAWLYKLQGDKSLASDYISKAYEISPFDEKIAQAYGELIL